MEVNNSNLKAPRQLKGRKKKKFFTKIREQMEFYFSDSNLARDNFLQDLLMKTPEGYVDLEVFRSFNKIKELTDDVNIIVDALSKSTKLQVNEDKTKVRRITPIGEPKDFDACTLYVEKLPQHADHKWIKDVFEHFGAVDYINIPKYKISNKIKGFAFIEFSDPESVRKACEFYKRSPGKENIDRDDQYDESKPEKTENSPEKERKARKRKTSSDADEPPSKKINSVSEKNSSSKCHEKVEQTSDNSIEKRKNSSDRKRKIGNIEDNEVSQKKLKETEYRTETSETEASETEKHQSSIKKTQSDLKTDNSDVKGGKIKKNRKHKKKSHHHLEKPVLRVMSKHEWKVFRNKYLNLQRSTMSYLKKQLLVETQELKELEPADEKAECEAFNKGFHLQPGVILKIVLTDSITDVSNIKEKVKAASHVAYVDAKLGHSEIFIRCHTPEEASFIIQEKKLDVLGTVSLLEGAEEKSYWDKIQEDRKTRFSIPLVRKKRGRDKLIAKATKLAEHKNKHIYFDE